MNIDVKPYENKNVTFVSIKNDTYTCKLEPTNDNINRGIKILIESNHNKRRWDIVVIESHIPNYSSDKSTKYHYIYYHSM